MSYYKTIKDLSYTCMYNVLYNTGMLQINMIININL